MDESQHSQSNVSGMDQEDGHYDDGFDPDQADQEHESDQEGVDHDDQSQNYEEEIDHEMQDDSEMEDHQEGENVTGHESSEEYSDGEEHHEKHMVIYKIIKIKDDGLQLESDYEFLPPERKIRYKIFRFINKLRENYHFNSLEPDFLGDITAMEYAKYLLKEKENKAEAGKM